jgi:2',5'-phosphodiesterase
VISCALLLPTQLAPASSYPTCNPDHLLASNRLPVILEKLESEIKADPHNTVVCLQEVSYEWAGAFHTFFANKGFHLVTGNYGKTFNGYMGVCTAWPTADYEVLDVDICRLADTREEGWPKFEKKSFVDGVVARFSGLLDGAMKQVGWKEDKETPPDHWTLSQRRFNVLVTTTLRDKKSGQAFSIGNYHMPCAYYCPMAMTLHADLCARRVQAVAANFEAPSVLA